MRELRAELAEYMAAETFNCPHVDVPPEPAYMTKAQATKRAKAASFEGEALTAGVEGHCCRRRDGKLPAFRLALRKVCACSPSSAAAERVFSILRNSFGKQQKNTLEDMYRLSLQLQFNDREV